MVGSVAIDAVHWRHQNDAEKLNKQGGSNADMSWGSVARCEVDQEVRNRSLALLQEASVNWPGGRYPTDARSTQLIPLS
jgi:hypothetical protein